VASDAELDMSKIPVLAKNLAKNFMNTFFAERGSRLTLDESVRLSAQVRLNEFHFRTDALICSRLMMTWPHCFAAVQIGPHLQACVAARLRSRHGGVLPQPLFMEEGNWIAMAGIPLISVEGTAAEGGAAADAEGGGTVVQHGDAHEAEGLATQGAEATHDDRAERIIPAAETPAHDVERAVAAEDATLAAHTSPEATATPTEDPVHAPAQDVHEAACEPTGGDADKRAHIAELEAVLLAVSSPAHEAPPENTGVA
jgi:hypothetical protein